jgi:hypothetical protein
LRRPARDADNRPCDTHNRTVDGFTRNSSATSASVSHGSSAGWSVEGFRSGTGSQNIAISAIRN